MNSVMDDNLTDEFVVPHSSLVHGGVENIRPKHKPVEKHDPERMKIPDQTFVNQDPSVTAAVGGRFKSVVVSVNPVNPDVHGIHGNPIGPFESAFYDQSKSRAIHLSRCDAREYVAPIRYE